MEVDFNGIDKGNFRRMDFFKLKGRLDMKTAPECQLPATKVASLGSETPNCLDTADLLTAETISRGLLITKAIIVRKLSNGLHSSE